VFALDTHTCRTVVHRADERFPICSVATTVAVAAVLRDLDRGGEFLTRRIRYAEADVARAGYAPITGEPENLANGMTVEALCAAAIAHSDNAAMNLLLRQLVGTGPELRGAATREGHHQPARGGARRVARSSPTVLVRWFLVTCRSSARQVLGRMEMARLVGVDLAVGLLGRLSVPRSGLAGP
jgi:hypothetical protein